MKKIDIFSISILLIINGYFSVAQNNSQSGKKNYNKFSNSKAIKSLEDMTSKETETNRLLAERYYISGNTELAEQYYTAVINSNNVLPKDYFRFALMLRVNKKYAESEKWIKKYGELNHDDSRVKEYMENKGATEKILAKHGQFKINNLSINSPEQDFGPAYLNNTIVFTSSREQVKSVVRRWKGNGLPFLDIYEAELDKTSGLVNADPISRKINKKFHDGPASFSADGKMMICTRNNYRQRGEDRSINLEMFTAEFIDGQWKNEKSMSFNNKDYSVGQPSLSPDGTILFFTSNMPGGYGGTDIYKSVKQKDGTWSKPENAGSTINTEGNEMFPFYHPEGILFFASDGHIGLGGLDIFMSHLKTNGYGRIENLGAPINTNKDDFAFILNQEMSSGYVCSNRTGGKGNDDIYSFNVLKPITFEKVIKGIAKDKNGNILKGVTLNLYEEGSKKAQTINSEDDGTFTFTVTADSDFILTGTKTNYLDSYNKLSTDSPENIINTEAILEKDPDLLLYGMVLEKGTNKVLKDVKVSLVNNTKGFSETLFTSEAGDFKRNLNAFKLNDLLNYSIKLEKEGYLSKSLTYVKKVDREGVYDLTETMELYMDKVSIGEDLAKIVSLNPIYFDFGKFNIRKDAATELAKMIKIMNDNPNMIVELGSHTDCRGDDATNLALSDKRAKASAEYIKKRITNPSRISGKGFGETMLKTNCGCEGTDKPLCTEEEHQQNRRTEFIIIKL
jgi:outer membrane protein OmpA-like peptidoglycan-associated protein